MLLSIENLESNNYKRFVDSFKSKSEWYVCSYQKRFDDDKGKKFFITINISDMRSFPGFNTEKFGIYNYEANVQYNGLSDSKNTFNVLYMVKLDTTIKEMEDFFANMWIKMDCDHYELFE